MFLIAVRIIAVIFYYPNALIPVWCFESVFEEPHLSLWTPRNALQCI